MSHYETILACWNSQKKPWKAHRKLTPDIRQAIAKNIKQGWDAEDICHAIDNYASCYHSKETKWTYGKWSLAEFLTRGKRDGDLRWVWFTDNNYREADWLTDRARRDRINQQRLVEQGEEIIQEAFSAKDMYDNMPPDKLIEQYKNGNTFVRIHLEKHSNILELLKEKAKR